MAERKIEYHSLGKSGRIEKFFGKRFRTDYESKPILILFWVMLIAYVPMLIMGAIDHSLFKGSVNIPYFLDYKSQFRALIAIPILIIARKTVNEKLHFIFNYIADKLLDEEQFQKIFAPAIAKIERLNEKGYDELVIVLTLIVYSVALGTKNVSLINLYDINGWFGYSVGDEVELSLMAKWHLFISMNIYRFIIVRWIWMYGCWVWILYKVSKCKLILSPYHADKVCGLNILMHPQRVFNTFFVAMAIISSGDLINQITYFGENFEAVKSDMTVLVGVGFVFLLAPYLLFSHMLIGAKNKAEVELGKRSIELSKNYQTQFIEKIAPNENEEPVDSSAIADFDAVYAKGIGIRPVLFSVRDVIGLAIPIALAFVPTLLTKMTIKELLGIVLGFVT